MSSPKPSFHWRCALTRLLAVGGSVFFRVLPLSLTFTCSSSPSVRQKVASSVGRLADRSVGRSGRRATDGWMDGWMDGLMEGWIEKRSDRPTVRTASDSLTVSQSFEQRDRQTGEQVVGRNGETIGEFSFCGSRSPLIGSRHVVGPSVYHGLFGRDNASQVSSRSGLYHTNPHQPNECLRIFFPLCSFVECCEQRLFARSGDFHEGVFRRIEKCFEN